MRTEQIAEKMNALCVTAAATFRPDEIWCARRFSCFMSTSLNQDQRSVSGIRPICIRKAPDCGQLLLPIKFARRARSAPSASAVKPHVPYRQHPNLCSDRCVGRGNCAGRRTNCGGSVGSASDGGLSRLRSQSGEAGRSIRTNRNPQWNNRRCIHSADRYPRLQRMRAQAIGTRAFNSA